MPQRRRICSTPSVASPHRSPQSGGRGGGRCGLPSAPRLRLLPCPVSPQLFGRNRSIQRVRVGAPLAEASSGSSYVAILDQIEHFLKTFFSPPPSCRVKCTSRPSCSCLQLSTWSSFHLFSASWAVGPHDRLEPAPRSHGSCVHTRLTRLLPFHLWTRASANPSGSSGALASQCQGDRPCPPPCQCSVSSRVLCIRAMGC